MMLHLTSILLGLGIGAVMGLTGAGGGILAIPALVLGSGLGMVSAKPVALVAVSLGSALSAADGLRRGLVRYKAAFYMVLLGALTAPVGLWLAHQVSPELLALLFSAIMLFVAWRTWRSTLARHAAQAHTVDTPCRLDPETGRFCWTPACFLTLGSIGAVTGLFTGMLGVGGGFFIVPMLQRYTNLTHHGIVLTSLAVIALVSGTTVLQGTLHGSTSIPPEGWYFIAATAVGMLASRMVAHRIPHTLLKRGFAALVLLATVLLLMRTFAPQWLPMAA